MGPAAPHLLTGNPGPFLREWPPGQDTALPPGTGIAAIGHCLSRSHAMAEAPPDRDREVGHGTVVVMAVIERKVRWTLSLGHPFAPL